MAALYRRCPLCSEFVEVAGYNAKRQACKRCDSGRLTANARTPHTEGRKAYLQRLTLPELRAYVQGQIHSRQYAPDAEDELRLIADRLEWVATSLITAGVDGWQATYGGLRAVMAPYNGTRP